MRGAYGLGERHSEKRDLLFLEIFRNRMNWLSARILF
jgi:hypothetical protein